MVDSTGGAIFGQPDLTGVSTKKLKCPDLPAWLKASDKIRTTLQSMGAIRGPDYDRYVDSCMTLLLDPTCGGNSWSLAIFFEFEQDSPVDDRGGLRSDMPHAHGTFCYVC
jgi:hypothetical protein